VNRWATGIDEAIKVIGQLEKARRFGPRGIGMLMSDAQIIYDSAEL